jgi:hypothetical protein
MAQEQTPETTPVRSVSDLVAGPFNAASRILPDSPVPIVLGTAALAVAGAIDWPVAGAIGLGYLALRRWH